MYQSLKILLSHGPKRLLSSGKVPIKNEPWRTCSRLIFFKTNFLDERADTAID